MKIINWLIVVIITTTLFGGSAFAETKSQEYTFSTSVAISVENGSVTISGENGVTTTLTLNENSSQSTSLPILLIRNITTEVSPLINDSFLNSLSEMCKSTTESALATSGNLTSMFENSLQYYPLYVDCFSNLTETRANLAGLNGINEKNDACNKDLTNKAQSLETCNALTNNINTENSDCKKDLTKTKSNQILYALGGAAIILAYYFWERKKKEAIPQMQRVDRS